MESDAQTRLPSGHDLTLRWQHRLSLVLRDGQSSEGGPDTDGGDVLDLPH